ncbi:MAG TPA: hypothetical protein VGG76_05925 [Gemmatimonadaceae bacterium]|jgi:hypothetical protein
MKARLVLLAAIAAVVGLNACGNPTSLTASLPTSTDSLSIFALSGTPAAYPSGLALVQRAPVRVDGSAGFDVAFDINANGDVVIYPVKLVVASPSSARPVGLQKIAGTFEQITTAPNSGFELDSALVMPVGQVVVVQSAHNISGDLCQFALNPNIFAKVVVDSINTASRVIYFKLGVDPNCGFRSFAVGIPTG